MKDKDILNMLGLNDRTITLTADDEYIYNKIKNKLIQDGFIYRCGFCMGLDVSGQYAKYPKNHKH